MGDRWGKVTELYKGSQESLYVKDALPPWVRSPDSRATRYWDLVSVMFIVWVATVVPFRIGFDVDLEPSFENVAFCIDAFIDLFFIVDVLLNFRTAYYLPTGFIESNPRMIRINYLRGWFVTTARTVLGLPGRAAVAFAGRVTNAPLS